MKKTWIVACSLLFVALAGFAQTPSPSQASALPPLTPQALAAILGQPAPATGGCAAQQNAVLKAAVQRQGSGEKALCNATASCGSYSISCSGNLSSSSCSAADRNCSAGERGHVTCDGVTTYCDCPCGGTVQEQMCCTCDVTGDCFACCRCAGGSRCAIQCSGGI